MVGGVILKKNKLQFFGNNEASKYLEKQNCTILWKNCDFIRGKFDIIAKDKDELVFCKVKVQEDLKEREDDLKSLLGAAKLYMNENNIKSMPIRFDVIEVYVNNNRFFINQITKDI